MTNETNDEKILYYDGKPIGINGTIERTDDGYALIRTHYNPWIVGIEGVECLNPDAPEEEQIYQKVFKKRKVYLDEEYDLAIEECLPTDSRFIVSVNGYSRITAEQRVLYGLEEGDYENACQDLLTKTVKALKEEFPLVNIGIVHGASYMGVDKSVQDAADELGIVPLGFSCPEYMMYVTDDDNFAVYVGNDRARYSDRYCASINFLITTGGREQAFYHDIRASVDYQSRIWFVDVTAQISRNGTGIPAYLPGENGKPIINNAAAVFHSTVGFYDHGFDHGSKDDWANVVECTITDAKKRCWNKMPPNVRFGQTDLSE